MQTSVSPSLLSRHPAARRSSRSGETRQPRPPFSSDPAIIEACLAGDEIAWRELISRYERMVYSILYGYRLAQPDVEDMFQNVFTIVLRKLAGLRDQELFAAWLSRITHRETQRFIRRMRNDTELEETLPDESAPAFEVVDRRERREIVEAALRQLPQRDEQLLRAFMQPSAPSYAEIAARLKIPVGSIGPTRARSFRKLEAVLREMGVDVIELSG